MQIMAGLFSVIGLATTVGGPADAVPGVLRQVLKNLARAGISREAAMPIVRRIGDAFLRREVWEANRHFFEWLLEFKSAQKLGEIVVAIKSVERLDALVHLGRHFGDMGRAVDLLTTLKGKYGIAVMEGVLETGGKIANMTAHKWSDEAFEGIAVWLSKSAKAESSLIVKVLKGDGILNGTGAAITGENLFKWVKQVSNVPALDVGLNRAITVANNLGISAVRGLYHQLDEIVGMGLQNVSAIECRYAARVGADVWEMFADAVTKAGEIVEYKSLLSYTGKYADEAVKQIGENLLILERNNVVQNYRIIFRGAASEAFRQRILKVARETLRVENRRAIGPANIVFRNKTVPF